MPQNHAPRNSPDVAKLGNRAATPRQARDALAAGALPLPMELISGGGGGGAKCSYRLHIGSRTPRINSGKTKSGQKHTSLVTIRALSTALLLAVDACVNARNRRPRAHRPKQVGRERRRCRRGLPQAACGDCGAACIMERHETSCSHSVGCATPIGEDRHPTTRKERRTTPELGDCTRLRARRTDPPRRAQPAWTPRRSSAAPAGCGPAPRG